MPKKVARLAMGERAAPLTGVILAAGDGRRMKALTSTPKPCLPVGNRALIDHQLALLAQLGVARVVIVVGAGADPVRRVARRHRWVGGEIRYVHQHHRRGIAHALQQVRELVGEPFVVLLGDLYPVARDPAGGLRRLVESPDAAAVLSIRRVDDPELIRRECTVAYDARGRLTKIVEKPRTPLNNLKPCGLYFFRSAVFDAIEQTPPSALRGEVELTDAIQCLIDQGHTVGRAATLSDDVNVNTPHDLLRANLVHLAQHSLRSVVHPSARVDPDAALDAAVVGARCHVGAGVRLERVVVLPGAEVTGRGTHSDRIIGPDGALGVSPRTSPAPLAVG